MTDEQLLPDAAKATGRNIAMIQRCSATKATVALIDKWNEDGTVSTYVWAPLSNDADAFRLAVDLGMVIHCNLFFDRTDILIQGRADDAPDLEVCEYFDDHPDKAAATRYAIVRAAAEIGRNREQPSMEELCDAIIELTQGY